jgi:hypothetical protein
MAATGSLMAIVQHLEAAYSMASERRLDFLTYLVGVALSQARRESYEATDEPGPARPALKRNGSSTLVQ